MIAVEDYNVPVFPLERRMTVVHEGEIVYDMKDVIILDYDETLVWIGMDEPRYREKYGSEFVEAVCKELGYWFHPVQKKVEDFKRGTPEWLKG